MRVTFGDHYLSLDLPEGLDYGFRGNGAMMAYVAHNDALNLHVSTITGIPKDPSHTNLAVERVAQEAREKSLVLNRIGEDKVFYRYEQSGQWEQYHQRLYTWIVGSGVRQIIFTASCLVDHPDFEQVRHVVDLVPTMIESVRPAESVA
ncbi:MAG TPA: hypothetical protein VF669_16610 [Tepidisphaeraceae bacterium]